LSAVPWIAIIGTAVVSLHHSHVQSCAEPTIPTAAMRSGIRHDSTNAMPPPFDNPSA